LQRVAAFCGKLRRLEVSCGVLRGIAAFCGELRRFAGNCGILRRLRRFAAFCGDLRRFAMNSFGIWVDHLFEQSCITSSNKYNAKKLKKIERRLPKKIKRTKKVDLQTAIATIITNPNETWKNLKREKYMVPKSYFQNNY
jgi:hypothetical protein